jgi:hypothetical protein
LDSGEGEGGGGGGGRGGGGGELGEGGRGEVSLLLTTRTCVLFINMYSHEKYSRQQ